MDLDSIKTLYDYNYWARDRILGASEGMTDEEYRKPTGFTYDGLHSILAHALAAEDVWATRFRGEELRGLFPESEVDTLAKLKQRWSLEEARMREYLDGLTEARLEEDLVFRQRDGSERSTPLWLLLIHVVNHGTQHRSEAAEALTMIGRSPESLDLTTMYWQA